MLLHVVVATTTCRLTYLSAGVLAPTLDTIMGIFWSAPPFTLNPKRPFSSGNIVMTTRAPELSLMSVAGMISAGTGRGSSGLPFSSGLSVSLSLGVPWGRMGRLGGTAMGGTAIGGATMVPLELWPEVLESSEKNAKNV